MSDLLVVDSHCHLDRLDLNPFQCSIDHALSAARANGVQYFLNVCVHPDTIPTLLTIAEHHPDVSISIGLHPDEKIEKEPSLEDLVVFASHPKVIAIGETGLDYYKKQGEKDRNLQQKRFRCHIQAARIVNKPLIVHTRCAIEDTLRILKEESAHTVGGILHCFSETLEMAQVAIETLGFYISFSGILTFKNAKSLKEIARQLPLERLLIETDSPYLTPEPFRGKHSNYPGYVVYVAETLAQLHGTSLQNVAQQTTSNFFQLFPTIQSSSTNHYPPR